MFAIVPVVHSCVEFVAPYAPIWRAHPCTRYAAMVDAARRHAVHSRLQLASAEYLNRAKINFDLVFYND